MLGDPDDIVESMRHITFDGDIVKHPLFSVTTAPIVITFQAFLPITEDHSILLVLALIAAINIAGVFTLLNRFFLSASSALLFTITYAFFFFNLVLFSIPETYALSALFILIYLSFLLAVREKLNWRNCLGLSFIAALASLYNPPLLSLMIVHILLAFDRFRFGQWLRFSLANVVLGGLLFLAINLLIHGAAYFRFVSDYGGSKFSTSNLLYLSNIANVLANFFLYSILAPVDNIPYYLGLKDIDGYLQSPLRWILLPIIQIGVFGGLLMAISQKTKNQRLALSLLAWILVLLVFYVCFTPKDASLWSLQILLPLLIILAIGFSAIRARAWLKNGALLLVSALMAVNNCLSFYAGPLMYGSQMPQTSAVTLAPESRDKRN